MHARIPWPARPTAAARLAWRPALTGLALFGALAALMAAVQFATPGLADNDGYYHMKMGWLMREQGLRPEFIWLPQSILGPDQFYNHHMLYQVYLGLFAGDGSPEAMVRGAKLASVLMPALAFTAIWWLLRGQGVPWPALWALGLGVVSEAFLYRMSRPRAQSAALLLLALGLHWLLQRRYWRLLPLGFVFVWLYNAFPLLLVLVGAYAAAALLTERELAWRAGLAAAAGVALGLVVNPYFPQNISFILSHIAPKVGDATSTSVGNEWFPYQTWTLVQNSGGALGAWLLGVLAIGWRGRRFDRAQLTAFFVSVLLGYMLFKSRRFIEYFPPFALVFAALATGPLLNDWLAAARERATGGAEGGARRLAGMARWLAPALGLALVAGLAVPTIRDARELMADSRPAETYAGASAWLRANTEPGSLVFQTDWDDFPRLFFYNTHNIYLAGLDPTYFELYDTPLYDEWVAITRGEVERPAQAIRERFGATVVISDLNHRAFEREAAADPRMREVYRDDFAVIWVVDS